MKAILALAATLALTGCASWSTSSIDQKYGEINTLTIEKKQPAAVLLSEHDMPDRKYTPLGDINVTVNKTTVFHANPTPEMVNEKLRERGAEIGADAVILVRYGKVGMSLMSWGSLEGKGRAIKFDK